MLRVTQYRPPPTSHPDPRAAPLDDIAPPHAVVTPTPAPRLRAPLVRGAALVNEVPVRARDTGYWPRDVVVLLEVLERLVREVPALAPRARLARPLVALRVPRDGLAVRLVRGDELLPAPGAWAREEARGAPDRPRVVRVVRRWGVERPGDGVPAHAEVAEEHAALDGFGRVPVGFPAARP
ncbi:hypothetical protein GSI_11831 [Ganoderma sinense ZZ0214-1]|uniref:Uncharacterized protein n=1 Tax=Ganoderma sinense ZZ0214-1 TaxID=1077348 RepID=A0A2G8RX61_9APHY|nr:hypothetical protein GSI_11831 [Ganoderma sinense ZZ0214-1]